jgi:predicted transposase YbfD/YdcC
MPSSRIAPLTDALSDPAAPVLDELTVGDRRGLLEALQDVPDPRCPQGIRYRLASLLAVAACAVMAGAVTYQAILDWVEDLDDADLAVFDLARRPALSTLWRLLTRLDSVALSHVLATWLLSRALSPALGPTTQSETTTGPGGPSRARRVIAVDGKTVRGTVRADGTRTHLLSAYDVRTGVTLAQVPLADKGGEIGHLKPLLDKVCAVLGSLDDVVIVADALHAQTDHAQVLAAAHAGLYVRVKANQPTVFAFLRSLPWAQIPVGDRTRDRGHGRRETRTCKTTIVALPGGVPFQHVHQVARITRTRRVRRRVPRTPAQIQAGAPIEHVYVTRRETAYLVCTVPGQYVSSGDLNAWARQEWLIENKSHHVRDTTLREDEQRARTGTGPAVFAALRNTAIGYHRLAGATNIARATRRAAHRPSELLHDVLNAA